MPISTIGSNSLNQTSDLTINGQTVGKGGGNVATNTVHGANTLTVNSSGANNAAFGSNVLSVNTSGGVNAGFGINSLAANTTGSSNAGFGVASLSANTTGNYNTACGQAALQNNTTASNNTAVGYQASYLTTTGAFNTAIGKQAGYTATTASECVFVGNDAGSQHTTGTRATYVGANSGASITSGANNVILGSYNGNQGTPNLDIRTGSNYIVLSDGNGNPRLIGDNNGNWGIAKASSSSKLYIYVNTNVTSDAIVSQPATDSGVNAYVFKNNAGGNAGYIQYSSTTTSYVTSSDYRLKENITPMTGALAKVAQLKPVTYDWKSGGSSQGFIAHELAEIVPDCVKGEKDALDKDGNPDYQGIDTSFLVATLTAAIQELKTIVDAQAAEIAELKAKVA